jgi:hypothetical protein
MWAQPVNEDDGSGGHHRPRGGLRQFRESGDFSLMWI